MRILYQGRTWNVIRDRMNGMIDIERIDGVVEDNEIPQGYRMRTGERLECVYKSDVKEVKEAVKNV